MASKRKTVRNKRHAPAGLVAMAPDARERKQALESVDVLLSKMKAKREQLKEERSSLMAQVETINQELARLPVDEGSVTASAKWSGPSAEEARKTINRIATAAAEAPPINLRMPGQGTQLDKIIRRFRRNGTPFSASDVENELQISRSNASTLCNTGEERGLFTKLPISEDGRRRWVVAV